MKKSTVTSLGEFTDFLQEACADFEINFFRGQRRDWPLLPKLARIRLAGVDLLQTESKMLRDFQRASRPLVQSHLVTLWDVVALAQHHGLPTRLLDWTTHALAALWFAVAEADKDEGDRVVWLYQPNDRDILSDSITSFADVKNGMVLEPSHVTPRITAQGGVFSVTRINKSKQQFAPLTDTQSTRKKLTKISIAGSSAGEIRWSLARSGIHAFSLFPDLDGLAKKIESDNSWLDDEIDPDRLTNA